MLAGRYRVDELVARGGMSEVYRGWDVRLERPVAVKVLAGRLAADDSAVRRMEREARAVARLQHPNVVAMYDHGEEGDGTPFLVMEWVDGPSLKELVEHEGALSEDEARRFVLQLLAALGHAHDHGLVHRDIKPQNVLIAPDGTAKLTDFGIARSADATAGLTLDGQIVGTAAYLSPEQARGEPVTPASDIYSTGAVLFELVTGQPPYAGDTPMAAALKHLEEPVPQAAASPAIASVVTRAMAKQPADRYPSAAAMAAALRADGDATLVLPAKPARRPARRGLLLAAALGGLAVVAGAGAWALSASDDGTPHAKASPGSSSVAQVAVPPLMGLQYVTASNRLEAVGLHSVRQLGGYDQNVKGSVVSVSRTGSVPPGTTLTLVVSSGPAPAPPPPEDKPKHKKKPHHHHGHHGNGNGPGGDG